MTERNETQLIKAGYKFRTTVVAERARALIQLRFAGQDVRTLRQPGGTVAIYTK